jgi:F-box interacting protein
LQDWSAASSSSAAAMESTVEGPRKRRQVAPASASASPHIPDDLVRRILLSLPSRSVLRCRAVCKTWLRMVDHPEFAPEHHRLQPVLPLVSFLRGAAASSSRKEEAEGAADRCIEAFDLRADEFRPTVRFADAGGRFHIHGSCDGLLLLSFEDRFYVCNPATHQWTRLAAPLRSSLFAGFYRHEPTGEYRALFYRGDWASWEPWSTDYYILVPDSRKGRGIGLPSENVGYEFRGEPLGPPVLAHGSLHWMPWDKQGRARAIMVFDTVTEVITFMDPPVIREHMSLLEVDGGELAMFISCGGGGRRVVTMVELWVLRDYANDVWLCEHRVRLPEAEVSTFVFDASWRVFFMSSSEGVVVVTPEQKLLHYDMNGTLRGTFPCNGRSLKITPYTLKESLVRHAFFEAQDNNGGDRDDEPPPPFFSGL